MSKSGDEKEKSKAKQKPDYIAMLHFLEKRNFSDGCARNTFILLLQSDLLQSDRLVSELITRFVHDAICPLSDLLYFLVLNQS